MSEGRRLVGEWQAEGYAKHRANMGRRKATEQAALRFELTQRERKLGRELGATKKAAGEFTSGVDEFEATLKRLALSNLVKKVGVKRTVNDIRALNRKLHEAAPATYPASTMALADASLDVLERSLRGLREDEQVQAAWRWFASLESDNPTFAAAILKTLLETLRPVKWAATLLSPDKSDAPPAEEPAAAAASPAADSRELEELLRRAKAAVPELEDYHVLLVPKSAFDDEEVGARKR